MKPLRADDETRTRDPHLGKVMRYQLRYIRIVPWNEEDYATNNLAPHKKQGADSRPL